MATFMKHYCERCQSETNHKIIAEKNISDYELGVYTPDYKYFMLQCFGCEYVSFRKETHNYQAFYPDENDNWIYDINIEVFPYPLKGHKPLTGRYILPEKIRTVYEETIDALKINCFLLSAVGFRAIIEAVCIDKKILDGALETKINNLEKSGFISKQESNRLHAVRFMGNDSVHDMVVPKENELYVVLEIVEHLLKNLYIIDHKAKPILDTIITNFQDFGGLLIKKLKEFKQDDDFPLAKYLKGDIRRLNGQIKKFETELIDAINNNKFDSLRIGDNKPFGNGTENVQHFIKTLTESWFDKLDKGELQ